MAVYAPSATHLIFSRPLLIPYRRHYTIFLGPTQSKKTTKGRISPDISPGLPCIPGTSSAGNSRRAGIRLPGPFFRPQRKPYAFDTHRDTASSSIRLTHNQAVRIFSVFRCLRIPPALQTRISSRLPQVAYTSSLSTLRFGWFR